LLLSSSKSSIPHSTFCIVIALFLAIVTIVSINGIGLNLSGNASAQQQDQANLTSVEKQELMEGLSFKIDNVTFSHHMAAVNGMSLNS
jgi:hypothetical protein